MKRLLIALVFSLELFAQESNPDVSKEQYWAKLLHYEDSQSIINTKDFFISQDGRTDLEAELKATLTSFKDNPYTKCKYPARYKWLRSLDAIEAIDVECKSLEKFLEPNFTKISIAYSTERYSQAASLFGHVLVKLDSKTQSNVIEYTAKIPKDTGPISYVYNGIFGGFVSKYNYFSYYAKNYEATDEEFRDLVIYELDFSKDQIENILLHLYEIKDTTQQYYFLTRNCSSELIKLLNMADYEATKAKDSKLFVLPVEVITSLDKRVKNIKLVHSKLKQFNYYYKVLDKNERAIFKKIVDSKMSINSVIRDKSIKKDSKDKILLSALLYYEINIQTKKTTQKVLSKILAISHYKNSNNLALKYEYKEIEKNPISPYLYKSSFGYLYKRDSFATLNIRNLYKNRFDLLDDLVKNGSVEILDLGLRINDKLSLEYLTLLHLSSMPISSEFFSEPTKEFSLGLKRLFYKDELYRYMEYGVGKRLKYNDNLSYAFSINLGAYNFDETLFGIGLKTDMEYKVLSKYLFRFGANIKRYEQSSFDSSLNEVNLFSQIHFKTSDRSLVGTKVEYFDNTDNYFTSSFYYNYSF